MEPEWTKQIPSKTICDVYYAFFVIYAFVAALAIVGFVMAIVAGPKGSSIPVGAYLLITAIAGTLSLFMYLICDRSLLATRMEKKAEAFSNRR